MQMLLVVQTIIKLIHILDLICGDGIFFGFPGVLAGVTQKAVNSNNRFVELVSVPVSVGDKFKEDRRDDS